MAEAAGLTLGAVVLIKPLCDTIYELWSTHRGFGKDAQRFRLRFAVQKSRLESFERVLFEDGKFLPAMPGRLIDHLPPKTSDNLLRLLGQLYDLLLEYVAVREQYKIHGDHGRNSDTESEENIASIAAMTPEERMKALTFDGQRSNVAQKKAVGWAKKIFWTIFDKSSTEKLVAEFEAWTERVKQLLEAAWWPLPFFETVARMRRLEEDADARTSGLLQGINLRILLAGPESERSLEIPAASFVSESRFGEFELGHVQHHPKSLHMVEYKSYNRKGSGAVSDVVIRQRIVQLASLLHEAPDTDPRLRVLRCINYFDDNSKSRFGFIYALPTSLNPTEGGDQKLTPASLATLLLPDRPRPALGTRLRLAHKLTMSLQRLHTYSWVHKSLRGEHILFFPQPQSSSLVSSSASTTATTLPDPRPTSAATQPSTFCLDDPKVTGFEYARQETDYSDQFGEADIKRNIYRHPSRWGQPTSRFQKLHDIYGEYYHLLLSYLFGKTRSILTSDLIILLPPPNKCIQHDKKLTHPTIRSARRHPPRNRLLGACGSP
jgi:hypothetical protein